jgi:hypothetical protein
VSRGFFNLLALAVAALLLLSWSIILYPDFWSKVRALGLPVPYCTTNDLAIGCEYKSPADYSAVHKIAGADPLVVTVTGAEPVDFLNTLCARARDGHNVLAIVNNVTEDANNVAVSLVSCGVKVKRAYVRDTIAVSPSGLLVISPDLSLFTDCNSAVSYELDLLQKRWRSR